MTFKIDPLCPGILRCSDCGASVAHVGTVGTAEPGELGELTAAQAMRTWPAFDRAIAKHDVACTWGRNPPPYGNGVYAGAATREED
jgi:hypothetical protein